MSDLHDESVVDLVLLRIGGRGLERAAKRPASRGVGAQAIRIQVQLQTAVSGSKGRIRALL